MAIARWAKGEAERLLGAMDDRWRHVEAVARLADQASGAVGEADRPVLVAAAWLHDVGDAPSLHKTGLQALDGALWIREQGQERIAGLVAYHSGAKHEAELLGLREKLRAFTDERSALQDYRALRRVLVSQAGEDAVPIFDEDQYPLPEKAELKQARWPKSRDSLARGILNVTIRAGALTLQTTPLPHGIRFSSASTTTCFPWRCSKAMESWEGANLSGTELRVDHVDHESNDLGQGAGPVFARTSGTSRPRRR